jgi:hypothetical protein
VERRNVVNHKTKCQNKVPKIFVKFCQRWRELEKNIRVEQVVIEGEKNIIIIIIIIINWIKLSRRLRPFIPGPLYQKERKAYRNRPLPPHSWCSISHSLSVYILIYIRIYLNPSSYCTTLQTSRSRVRFPMVSLEFFSDIILPVALWPRGGLNL